MIEEDAKGQYVPVSNQAERVDDELSEDEQRLQNNVNRQYSELAH